MVALIDGGRAMTPLTDQMINKAATTITLVVLNSNVIICKLFFSTDSKVYEITEF